MRGVGVDERDLETEEPRPRLLVDQLRALVGEVSELAAQVADLVRDVVHAGAALREKPADGRVVAERREELEATVPDAHRGRLHALIGHGGAVLDGRAEEALVRVHRCVEIVDRDTEVVNRAGAHGPDASDGAGVATVSSR